MANMSLNVNFDNLTEEECNQLLALVKKSMEEKPKVWKPKDGETYYYIVSNGDVSCTDWSNCGDIDNDAYSIGNCYRTKQDAEFAVEKQKVITELKRFAQEHNEKINWNDRDEWKFHIIYNFYCDNKGKIKIESALYIKTGDVYFSSMYIAQQAIDTIGEDRLKKYYFEVED